MFDSVYQFIKESDSSDFESKRKIAKKILDKWSKTGLLEGLQDKRKQSVKTNTAFLLENQLRQTKKQLTEASAMASGDVQGFAHVAFPMIRRIFANIVANELVSVQPMSQPTGLIFFLDFQASTNKGVGHALNASVYGGGVVGSQLTGGVNLSGTNLEAGINSLNFGYSSPTASSLPTKLTASIYGTVGSGNDMLDRAVDYDIDLSGTQVGVFQMPVANLGQFNQSAFVTLTDQYGMGTQIRRLTGWLSGTSTTVVKLVYVLTGTLSTAITDMTSADYHTFKFAINDDFQNVGSSALGATVGDPTWGLEFGGNTGENAAIPEIDIKIDSVSITTLTKKLKARWTPELAQDLDAYQNLDAEVELTSVISEQVGLEIDAEILNDLIANAAKVSDNVRFWSRRPGKYLEQNFGSAFPAADQGDFTGNQSEWYMTLLEKVNDVSANIHRRSLRGGATFIVTSPEVASILKSTNLWYADVDVDDEKGKAGISKAGTLSNMWDIYVTPHFRRELMLIGRKGSGALETGYIYAPYVPLQTTPAIPDPDTFVLNKGVMTRYGKKMIRPDLYGIILVRDLKG
jgi:hypothetical protein